MNGNILFMQKVKLSGFKLSKWMELSCMSLLQEHVEAQRWFNAALKCCS